MSVNLASFYDLIMPEVGGCTTDFVDLNLRETAREFCRSTGAWTNDFAAVDLIASQATYTIPVVTDAELVAITKLTVNGAYLWENVEEKRDLNADSGMKPKYVRDNAPFSISPTLLTITLETNDIPTASVTGGLVMSGTLRPSATATTLPDFLKSQYSEAMRLGTLARLMMMGRKPWTDRVLAVEYAQKFKTEMNFAAFQADVSNTRQTLRVKKWG